MPTTYVDYPATAAQTDFAFTFPYLENEHVIVEIDGVQKTLTTDYTIVTSPSTKIVLTSGATAGQIVRVRRKSQPGTDLVDFENGSVLTESELDRAYLHNRYLNEEISELNDASLQKEAGGTDWDAGGSKIKNVGAPTLTADATTKQYVDDKVNQLSSGASAPPTKWVFTGTAGANTTYSVTGAEVNGDTAYDVSVDGSVLEPTTDYTVDPDTDTLTIVNTLSGGEDIVVIERGFGVAVTGTIGSAQLQSNAVTTAKIADHSVTAVKISNTDPIFNVQTTGEVGIGTVSPSAKLQIDTSDNTTIYDPTDGTPPTLGDYLLAIRNDYTGGNVLGTFAGIQFNVYGGSANQNAVAAINLVIEDNNTRKGALTFTPSSSTADRPEAMRIDSSGNIGLGTTSPDAKLEIVNSSNHLNLKVVDTISQSVLKFSDSAGLGGAINYDHNTDKLHLITDGTATPANGALNIDSDGKVGIGTVSPSAPLEVDSTTGGVVFPRLTTIQRDAISSPTDGETIFNTTNNQLESYNGSDWVVGGGGVSKYTTGWTNISSTLANDTEFTFTHNLGTTDILVNIYASTSPTGTAEVILVGGIDIRWDGANQMYGAQIVDITNTTLKIRTGSPGWNKKTSGSFSTTNWNASYIKVVAVG